MPVEYVFQDEKGEFQAELRPFNSPLGFTLDADGSDVPGIKYPTYIKVEFDRLLTLRNIPANLIMELVYNDGRIETVKCN